MLHLRPTVVSVWADSAAVDSGLASLLAQMKAQNAGLATTLAVDPCQLFTDIIDGIEDVTLAHKKPPPPLGPP